jgi:uncharacterized protein
MGRRYLETKRILKEFMMQLHRYLVLSFFACLSPFSFAQTGCPPALPTIEQAQAYMSANAPKNSGYLWRVEKDGRTSWLYGTVHYNHMEFAMPGMKVMSGARQSDVLAMELILSQPQATPTVKNSSLTFIPSEQQKTRMKAALMAACIPNVSDDALFSAPVLTSLSELDNSRSLLSSGYSADRRLDQFARRSGKPMVALENMQSQLDALVDPNITTEQLSQRFDALLTGIETGSTRKSNEELVVMWQKNDLEKLIQFEASLTLKDPALAKRLNDDRNKAMAEKIVALHDGGKRVFTAVGSLHMVGQYGLPKLMELAGFKVTYVSLN